MQTDTHEALDSYVVGPRGRIRRPRTGGRTRKKPENQIRLHPRFAPPDGRDPLRRIRRRGGETRGGALRRRRGGRNGPTPAGDLRDRGNRPGGNRRTVGGSALIRRLSEAGKIDTAPLEGAWERYLIQTVANPLPGIRTALVIAGSDRRGAAYGLFTLSELIGVSPWYWWADVPVKKHAALHVDAPPTYSQTPSVRYRGIFLNDEDWGLTPWASQTFEPERGNIGPRTYAKVCELLLRLKANYLAPAMHPVSTSFNQIPENKLVADTFAIVMGSTHCEPLLLNTASEWDTKTMGPWNYDKNKEGINRVLTQRVRENSPYENVYTLALRGLHDGAMSTTLPMHEKVRMLQQALLDQRRILAENIDRPVETVPQAFTPYKEVLEIYSNGLELPDDVTIVWPDDNYGYMKRLSGVREQRRTGRSGVYYHVSYLGVPHSYLWFSTTPPSLMYEELRKAYDTTADRLWLLNCGDLKGSEMQVSLFLDMAWDIGRFTADNVVTYPARWLAGIFGEAYYDRLEAMTREHLRLAFPRKPEYMGWGYHWNRFDHNCEQLTDTDFSFTNYDEAQRRLEAYRQLGARAEALLHEIGDEARPAFYQLVYYPLRGAELMNRMTLGGQRNRWYARQGRAATNAVRDEVQRCYDSLQVITRGYNSLLGGKWNHMMSMRQNYDGVSAYFNLPHLATHDAAGAPQLALQVAGEDVTGARAFHALPAFDNYLRRTYPVEIYNRGGGTLAWTAHASEPWVVLSKSAGKTADEERITVGIDWEKAPSGNAVPAQIVFRAGEQSEKVLVSLFNPTAPSRAELRGIYVENNGCVSIPAAGCHRVRENDRIKITAVEDLGIEGPALQLGDPTAPLQIFRSRDVPCAEYDFYAFDAGSVDVYTYVLPTFPLHADRDFRIGENTNTDTKYSVQIDDGALATPSSSHVEYSQVWFESVLRNCAVNKSTLHIDKPGRHTLRIRVGDPGIVLQKIVLDFGGMKRSYLGPQSTLIE